MNYFFSLFFLLAHKFTSTFLSGLLDSKLVSNMRTSSTKLDGCDGSVAHCWSIRPNSSKFISCDHMTLFQKALHFISVLFWNSSFHRRCRSSFSFTLPTKSASPLHVNFQLCPAPSHYCCSLRVPIFVDNSLNSCPRYIVQPWNGPKRRAWLVQRNNLLCHVMPCIHVTPGPIISPHITQHESIAGWMDDSMNDCTSWFTVTSARQVGVCKLMSL